MFAGYVDPALTSLLRRPAYGGNVTGGLLVRPSYAGALARVVPTVRQVFTRVPAGSLADADDARFAFFRDRLLPELVAGLAPEGGCPARHTVLFVPSYFDYVRLRNLLDAREVEFVTACEYTEDADVARARTEFFAGDMPLLMLTERFHYFRRYRVRGIRHVLFYGPPANGHLYAEVLNLLEEATGRSEAVSCTTLFTRYDAPALERVVGTARVGRLLEDGPKSSFVFV